MSGCDSLWLAARIVWALLLVTTAGLAIFFAGYHHGRRLETEERERDEGA